MGICPTQTAAAVAHDRSVWEGDLNEASSGSHFNDLLAGGYLLN